MSASALAETVPLEGFREQLQIADCGISAVRGLLDETFKSLDDAFVSGVAIEVLVRERAALIDCLVTHAWHRQGFAPEDFALLAVGGYGRGELHPYSDIDLAIVLRRRLSAGGKTKIEQFLTYLWDVGLQIGSSVRSLRECKAAAKDDITIVTNLMESRLLAGGETVYQQVLDSTSAKRIWPPRKFFAAKKIEQTERHQRFHNTVQNLEPHIKDGPGGLRDIQTIVWVALRHYGTGSIASLAHRDILSEAEAVKLQQSLNFLWRVRYALHYVTGRAEERLLFDHQREVAQLFGYADNEAPNGAIEQFMKMYYQTAIEVARLCEVLLQVFEDEIMRGPRWPRIVHLNKRFSVRNNLIEARGETVFAHYPFALLEVFLLLQQNENAQGIRASTIRLIRDHVHLIDDKFRADIRARSLFIELLRNPKHLGFELQRMHRYGVLSAYLPQFRQVMGLMQFDLFHAYTVDQHTIQVVRRMRELFVKDADSQVPEYPREIAAAIPKPELLYIAGLFHDIAKGRGGDHSQLGEADARAFCEDHGLPAWDTDLVCWLVRQHLLMSQTAQRKDIADPNVVNEFAAEVRDRTRLSYLYCLTVADIRGTNSNLWTSWKDALLQELFDATAKALRRGLSNPLQHEEQIRNARVEARKRLDGVDIDSAKVEKLWQSLDDEYFLRHTPSEVLWHAQQIVGADESDLPLISLRPETERGGTEILIYARDRDYLFSIMTRTLDQLHLNIVDARIVTSADGYTLDSYFVLEAATGDTVREAKRIEEIRSSLQTSLASESGEVADVNRRTDRKLAQFSIKTSVNFEQDEQLGRTIMEVITNDQPGVLSRIGMAMQFCGVRLQNARIATYGERVEDIFYLTDQDNQALVDPVKIECLTTSITDALNED